MTGLYIQSAPSIVQRTPKLQIYIQKKEQIKRDYTLKEKHENVTRYNHNYELL